MIASFLVICFSVKFFISVDVKVLVVVIGVSSSCGVPVRLVVSVDVIAFNVFVDVTGEFNGLVVKDSVVNEVSAGDDVDCVPRFVSNSGLVALLLVV